MIALATAVNFGGTKALGIAAITGFSTEIPGALAVGGWLLASRVSADAATEIISFAVPAPASASRWSYSPRCARG